MTDRVLVPRWVTVIAVVGLVVIRAVLPRTSIAYPVAFMLVMIVGLWPYLFGRIRTGARSAKDAPEDPPPED